MIGQLITIIIVAMASTILMVAVNVELEKLVDKYEMLVTQNTKSISELVDAGRRIQTNKNLVFTTGLAAIIYLITFLLSLAALLWRL